LNISTLKSIGNNNIQKNDSQSVNNNNELMREIKKFNLRFNYGNNIKNECGKKISKENKAKKLIKKLSQNNKSAEQTKYSILKNRINIANCQLNNMENNCLIF
jgi:hypothetical protein